MTTAIRDILFDVASEFATTDDVQLAKVDRFIARAAEEVNRDAYGAKADEATAYLAAHKLTIAGRKGANQGAVIKERVGDLERGYAAPSSAGSDVPEAYRATSYGVEFWRLGKRKGQRATPLVL
jgi:hypothetical protein